LASLTSLEHAVSARSRPRGVDRDTAGAISTRVVGLLREHTGRGATKAKTRIASDLVVITLADCLTTAERQVVAAGHGELVVRTRGVLHHGCVPRPRRSSKS